MNFQFLVEIFQQSLEKIGVSEGYKLFFESPKNPENGDLATNVAMQLAKAMKQAPRQIAETIINNLEYDKSIVESIEIAGAGFINIKFANNFFYNELVNSIKENEEFGKNKSGAGRKVNVEYVSANPTGLLHMGHGRNACIGDTVANMYEWNGWEVTREYYFNNAGNQMNNLGKSIFARYMNLLGEKDFPFPEDGYHGTYIIAIAEMLLTHHGDALKDGTTEDLAVCRKYGEQWCFDRIIETMKALNVHHDIFFNEDTLYTDGKVKDVIDNLKSMNLAYEKEGALWIALSKMGLKDDRVIVKSSGEPTYRLPDIAYHIVKFQRGYDHLIDVFGADHIATVPDVLAALKALNYDISKIDVLIHQFVTLTENGEQVKMSKRSGKSYTLDELIEEVGSDVVRFFFLMRGITTHLEFDLALAREQSDKNPVFYLQYAHARISSVLDTAKDREIVKKDSFDPILLKEKQELDLIKILLKFPAVVESSCEKCEPQILAEYLRELAAEFHVFYHDCRILGVDSDLQNSRLHLANITKIAMRNGLTILGINAPDRM
jgi:arginyl-tRNA synthetase